MIPCACGCGTEIPARDSRGRPRRYARGHANKGGSNTWLARPDSTNVRTCRERARKLTDVSRCELAGIGRCKGPIDAHHIDGDATNNAEDNRIALCRSHHFLVERDRIDLTDPVMPAFRVDGSGKRRYEWSTKAK